jgi:hypothetical protein
MIDVLIQAVIYTTTAIATLRAGSRAIYAYQHAEIGVMDGPLILSPQDIAAIQQEGNNKEIEVSPLWEHAFGFSEAVRRLHDEDGLQTDEDVYQGNLKDDEEASNYYSMAWPHKTLQQIQSSKISCKEEYLSDVTSLEKEGEKGVGGSLISVGHNQINGLKEHQSLISLKRCVNSHAFRLYRNMKELLLEIWKYHPLFRVNSIFTRKEAEFKEDEKEEGQMAFEDEHLSFDTFYSTDVNLPIAPKNTALGEVSIPTYRRIAQVKAFAPKAFARLRSRFGIHEEDFLTSILKSGPFVSFQSNSKGALRVGGFFFFTRDGAYMIKTIKVRT